MKILSKLLFVLAITTLLLAQVATVAGGQEAQNPQRRREPNPPPDNSDMIMPSFSLAITVDMTSVAVGEKLKVEVTITNTSDADIFYESGGLRPFGLEVRDETGREVARTEEGLRAIGQGSAFAASIHPGDSIRRSARLDKEFELDKPGNYFVQASRGISRKNRITSNTIMITIIP
jgi:hypothetical protein